MASSETPIWKYVDQREDTVKDAEMYTKVADLYHEFRPRYSKAMIDLATADLPKGARILEIGCGPGTATLPFLERRFWMTCIEPGSGMIAKAKKVCHDHKDRVTFRHMTLADFNDQDETYDAILAATSFHWAMDSKGELIQKCHRLLKPDGKLILLWNLPPEPNENVRKAVATAASKPIPFYFGGHSVTEHQESIQNKILDKVEQLGLFGKFSEHKYERKQTMRVSDFVGLLYTFSPNIRLPTQERDCFFRVISETMNGICGSSIYTEAVSLLNVAKKVNTNGIP